MLLTRKMQKRCESSSLTLTLGLGLQCTHKISYSIKKAPDREWLSTLSRVRKRRMIMKIGEFAKICNTKISVLRHYDKKSEDTDKKNQWSKLNHWFFTSPIGIEPTIEP